MHSPGEDEERPGGSSAASLLASGMKLSSLPPLVADDDPPGRDSAARSEEEPAELKRFREQWRSELKRARDDQPGAPSEADASSSSYASSSSSSSVKRPHHEPQQHHQTTQAVDEWKRLRDEERRNTLLISRELAEPLPFAVPADEPLVITVEPTVMETLHVGLVPDEVLVYLLCFLDEVSLMRFALSCKKSYSLSREPVLWRLICQRIWAHNCAREAYLKFGTWQRMFLNRPRVRLDGIFVSKNTYLRPGSTEWSYHQPVHQVVYYRYLRILPQGRLMYAMALDLPRKVLKWFNLRALEQSEKDKGRERATTPTSRFPSPGTYSLDDVSGSFEMWVQGNAMTQNFVCTLRRKKAGKHISVTVVKYIGTSKSGIKTDYDSVPIAPFHFYKLPPHMLDPVAEETAPK